MDVLLIHQYFLEDEDGGGSRWNEMSRLWVSAGHKVTVLAGMEHYMHQGRNEYGGIYHVKKVNKNGVKVIRCFVTSNKNSGFKNRIAGYFSFVFSGIYAGIVYAKEDYDLIIVTSPPLFVGISALALSWIKRIPFLVEVRDLWPESAIETGVLQNRLLIRMAYWFESYLYKRAKIVNVLTPAFHEILIQEKNISPDKIIFIPNAADFTMAEEAGKSFNRDEFRRKEDLEDRFVIIYVGAHGIANHLIQIVETAEMLRDTKAYFLLIGAGPEKDKLVEEAAARNLKNVRFVDFLSKTEVFQYILASDAGTSVLKKAEIFKTVYSNKTFDYFSCAKPVLMVIDGVSRKLAEDADAGIFVEPENPLDFANKIRYYLANPKKVVEQGQNGYIYAKKHFDREILAKKFLEEILEKPFR